MGMIDMVRDWFTPARGRNVMPPAIRADFMRGNRGVVFGGWRPALREAPTPTTRPCVCVCVCVYVCVCVCVSALLGVWCIDLCNVV